MNQSETRAARRARAAERNRQRRKGQRAYTKKELRREREAGDLAQFFAIVDRQIAVPQSIFERAQLAIDDRRRVLQKEHPDWTWGQAIDFLRGEAAKAPAPSKLRKAIAAVTR